MQVWHGSVCDIWLNASFTISISDRFHSGNFTRFSISSTDQRFPYTNSNIQASNIQRLPIHVTKNTRSHTHTSRTATPPSEIYIKFHKRESYFCSKGSRGLLAEYQHHSFSQTSRRSLTTFKRASVRYIHREVIVTPETMKPIGRFRSKEGLPAHEMI